MIIEVNAIANGGLAMGRDKAGRPVFVPFAIPGEKLRVDVQVRKKNYTRAKLREVIDASPTRVEPRCPHFTVCGGCHFQHMTYDVQLQAKADVVRDQLKRIGGFKQVLVRPTLANPTPWAYRVDISLSRTPTGELGLWSPSLKQVIPIETCYIVHPQLLSLWQDVNLALPELRKLTLRVGDDEALLAAIEVEDVEPPELEVDFPVSVAIVLPNKTSASLIGDHFLIQNVKTRDFRVSAGCYFPPSPAAAELMVDTVLQYANLDGRQLLLDAYSGIGLLTSFLASEASQVIGIEVNPDAIADATVNLDDYDNVNLYQGRFEEITPMLDITPDVVILHPPANGLSPAAIEALAAKRAGRFVYVSSDIATLARDGKQLSQLGYQPVEVQPIDMTPQAYPVEIVSLWQRFA
jgi:23S rRNA (uracil1939-C5)-methyltransferase